MACYALEYDIPNHYEKKYRNGEFKMRNTFKDVFFHSENDEPAIQFPAHWEYWEKDLIKKVVAYGK